MSDPLTLATWILGPVLGIYTLLFIVTSVRDKSMEEMP
jgi:hypothetical protein